MANKIEDVDVSKIEEQKTTLEVIAKNPVTNQETYDKAVETIKSVKALMKEVDETFNELITQAHQLHKTALSKKAKYYDPLKKMEAEIKKKMTDWVAEQRRIQLKAEQEAAEARRKEEDELKAMGLDDVPVFVEPVAQTFKTAGVSYIDVWDFEIVDEALIPREYLAVDHSKISGVVKSMKDATSIPGIKIVTSQRAVVR